MTILENRFEELLDQIDSALDNGNLTDIPTSDVIERSLSSCHSKDDLDRIAELCIYLAKRIDHLYKVIPPGYLEFFNELFDAADELIAGDSALYRGFADDISTSAKLDFPWERIALQKRGVAVLYNFAPFADTGASVASKRLRQMASKVDVVSCSSLGKKAIDSTPFQISNPYIDSHTVMPIGPAWGSWRPQADFIHMALRKIEQMRGTGRKYEFIYTRAMWVPSHYVGAIQKLKQPQIEWIAEFSDPLSLDVNGRLRAEHPPEDDPTFDNLVTELQLKFGDIPKDEQGIFRMAELLPYAFADEIVFTNELQRITMLNRISNDVLRERVVARSVVSNHPTLPLQYYKSLETLSLPLSAEDINLGYFGDFYASRGLQDVTRAMRMLPDRLLNRLKLHVFTTFVPEHEGGVRPIGMKRDLYEKYVARTLRALGDSGLEDNVVLHPSLPYMEFLSVLERFDYLIVNDAESGSGHEVNPYLPSKYGDYKGSSSRIWALCEANSCLDISDAHVKTRLGDVNQARAFLYDVLSARESRNTLPERDLQ